MADVMYSLVVVAFFVAAAGCVRLCARITGIDNGEANSGGITGDDPGPTGEPRS